MRRLSALLLLLLTSAAAQPAGHAEEVTYASGDVELAATLAVPPGEGPFPTVVLVHGSGASDRSNPWTAAYAEALVARGVAVLHPDKRGSGASGGRWQAATFEVLAHDAAAGVAWLRGRPEVDPARIGLVGFSQGGQIVPTAATLAPVAFVVSVSGAAVPFLEQVADEVRQMGEREGLSDADLVAVAELQALAVAYARTGEGWAAYAAARDALMAGPLGATDTVSGFPDAPDAGVWEALHAIGDADPMESWRQVEVPALFVYGGQDRNVDAAKSVDRIERELADAGPPYAILRFRDHGHALFREDVLDVIARWAHDGGKG